MINGLIKQETPAWFQSVGLPASIAGTGYAIDLAAQDKCLLAKQARQAYCSDDQHSKWERIKAGCCGRSAARSAAEPGR
jgi:hypothetical protein